MKFSLAFIIGTIAFLVNIIGGMFWAKAVLWGIGFWVGSAVILWILAIVLIAMGVAAAR